MLAKRVDELPAEGDWIFEPKWDGFRALVFRDGDEIFIQSRDEKPLNRYFPELLEPLRAALPARCVLDGERSEEHTSELQSQFHLVCRLLLEKKKKKTLHLHSKKKKKKRKKNKI